MLGKLRYLWTITSGYRLRPWASPYLRWRLKTYFGRQGDVRGGSELFALLWRERREMWRFLNWVEEQQSDQRKRTAWIE
jgi:hypothetical protein